MALRKARLFLGNLPLHSSEGDINQRLKKYGTVNSVEIKQKKDFDSDIITSTFAYVNLETEESTLQQCLRELRSKDWNGSYIKAELAKESFLDRLNREREDASKSSSAQGVQQQVTSKNSNTSAASLSVKEELPRIKKTSFNDGFKEPLSVKEDLPRKRKTSFNDNFEEPCEEKNLVSRLESFSDFWKDDPPAQVLKRPKKEGIVKNSDSFREHSNKKYFPSEDYSRRRSNGLKDFTDRSAINSESFTMTTQTDTKNKLPDADRSSAAKVAELKRVKALEEKSKALKQQKDAIKHALSSIDQVKTSNKIIFDDDGDPVSTQVQLKVGSNNNVKKHNAKKFNDYFKEQGKQTSKGNGQLQLFGADDDDNDNWHGDFRYKKQFEGKKGKQLLEMQARFKDDKRFIIDERFYESDDDKEEADKPSVPGTEEENELQEEKAKEMEILASVLGQPVQPNVSKKSSFNPMIRFDPFKPNHAKFELPKSNDAKMKLVDIDQKKKSGKVVVEKVDTRVEQEPLPVDEKQFYQVASHLRDLFKKEEKAAQSVETGTFSLRQMFTSNEPDEPTEEVEVPESKPAEMTQSRPRSVSRPVLRGFQDSRPLAMFSKKLLRPELSSISNTFCKDVDVEAIKEKFSEKRRILGRMLHKKRVILERQQHFKQKIGAASLAHKVVDRESAIRRKFSKPWEKKRGRR